MTEPVDIVAQATHDTICDCGTSGGVHGYLYRRDVPVAVLHALVSDEGLRQRCEQAVANVECECVDPYYGCPSCAVAAIFDVLGEQK